MKFAVRRMAGILTVWVGTFGILVSEPHPRLLVTEGDRPQILEKIKTCDWAAAGVRALKETVDPHVERHGTNRAWILSRLQLYWGWAKGIVFRPDGTFDFQYESIRSNDRDFRLHPSGVEYIYGGGTPHRLKMLGCAPRPTVRYPHKDNLTYPDGGFGVVPSLEEVEPFSTTGLFPIRTTAGHRYMATNDFLAAQINGQILGLARDAAFLHWLTGRQEYARFATDILLLTCQAASQQNATFFSEKKGADIAGYLTPMVLEDGTYTGTLPLLYDLLEPWLRKNSLPTGHINRVLLQFAQNFRDQGLTRGNFNVVEMQGMVLSALAQDDVSASRYYLSHALDLTYENPRNRTIGTRPLSRVMVEEVQANGFWPETPAYHNYPVSYLMATCMVLEKNGHDVFKRYPTLFRMTLPLFRFAFPDGSSPGFGDSSLTFPHGPSLEFALAAARRHGRRDDEMALAGALKALLASGRYAREQANPIWALAFFLPELPPVPALGMEGRRSDAIPHAGRYLLRNGSDENTALMLCVGGGPVGHGHKDGLSMEIYGAGYFMGREAGRGPLGYASPVAKEAFYRYYSMIAAHNTVVVEERSRGTWAPPVLEGMEPWPGTEAISSNDSFVDLSYMDGSTSTPQRRLMGLHRGGDRHGYIVDIFHSSNRVLNDYLYHNIGSAGPGEPGSRPTILGPGPNMRPVAAHEEPTTEDFPFVGPGYGFFSNKSRSEPWDGPVVADFRFSPLEGGVPGHMKLWIKGGPGRTYCVAEGPPTGIADPKYFACPMPTLMVRQEGSCAWENPFVVVYEPHRGDGSGSIEAIEYLDSWSPDDRGLEALSIRHRTGAAAGRKREVVLHSVHGTNRRFTRREGDFTFSGTYGVAAFEGLRPTSLYLGRGSMISAGGHALSSREGEEASGILDLAGGEPVVRCDRPCQVLFRFNNTNGSCRYTDLAVFAKRGETWKRMDSARSTPDAGVETVGEGRITVVCPAGESILSVRPLAAYDPHGIRQEK